jgi:hypothetical protein
MEIMRDLALIPESRLDEVHALVKSILGSATRPATRGRSLRGIWKGTGLEKIVDLESEIKAARHFRHQLDGSDVSG